MAQFSIGHGDMGDPAKLHAAIRKATQNHDLDTGWIELNAARTVNISNLGILPRMVIVYSSDNRNGDGYGVETFSGVTAAQLTVGGAKKYARVLANR